jgi:hypothetical protein
MLQWEDDIECAACVCDSLMVALLASIRSLAAVVAVQILAQGAFGQQTAVHTPILQLSSITAKDEFTTLTHPRFRGHSVRVKQTDFCDPTVK